MGAQFCVGLTGGIGSGKTSAARIFQELGAAVVDTDEIARELTRPGAAALADIRAAFGDESIDADGGLARAHMRQLVFSDATARRKLESILHPRIREEVRARVAASRAPYVVVVVPLLLETGAYRDLTTRVLVIDCSEDVQIARTMSRSGLSENEVRAIMATQLPRAKRLAVADDVLHNDGAFDALRLEATALHARYVELARVKCSPTAGG